MKIYCGDKNVNFQGTFLKQKRSSVTMKIRVSLRDLELLNLAQLHFLFNWVHAFHRTQSPKHFLQLKNSKIQHFQATSLKLKRRSVTKQLKCLQQKQHYYTLFIDIFSESRCMRFIESSHQSFLRGKKTLKIEIFRLFFKAETNGWNQKD